MVCFGNICRSPLAEGILKNKIKQNNLLWEVDSAATSNWHVGEPPHPKSIAQAALNGIDISKQVCRQILLEDFDIFDVIYVMDLENYIALMNIAQTNAQKNKVKLILNEVFPNQNMEVSDPYFHHNYEQTFNILNEACNAIINNYFLIYIAKH